MKMDSKTLQQESLRIQWRVRQDPEYLLEVARRCHFKEKECYESRD